MQPKIKNATFATRCSQYQKLRDKSRERAPTNVGALSLDLDWWVAPAAPSPEGRSGRGDGAERRRFVFMLYACSS